MALAKEKLKIDQKEIEHMIQKEACDIGEGTATMDDVTSMQSDDESYLENSRPDFAEKFDA